MLDFAHADGTELGWVGGGGGGGRFGRGGNRAASRERGWRGWVGGADCGAGERSGGGAGTLGRDGGGDGWDAALRAERGTVLSAGEQYEAVYDGGGAGA